MSAIMQLAKDDEYVKNELVELSKKFGQKGHPVEEWKGWINGLAFLYLHCNESMRPHVQAFLEQTTTRMAYVHGINSLID